MNQEQVKRTYLSVIDVTIRSLHDEFSDKGLSESAFERLECLQQRWIARLTQTHEFVDDPEIKKVVSTSRARASPSQTLKRGRKRNSIAACAVSSSRNENTSEVMSSSSERHTQNFKFVNKFNHPFVPDDARRVAVGIDNSSSGSSMKPPPTKRAKTRNDDDDSEAIETKGEDFDISDYEVRSITGSGTDDVGENVLLAQTEKVKKGNVWKITLSNVIVSIRGREYLFNKAKCCYDDI